MNGANATLGARAADGSVVGLSADLGKFIAARLDMPYEAVVYAGSADYTASFGKGEWDIIVTGRNPFAEKMFEFMPEVILIKYVYVAAPGRAFADSSEVDRAGVTIGVPRNASADAYLTPQLKSAVSVRAAGNVDAAIELLSTGKADVYASGTDGAHLITARLPGSKIVPRPFHTVSFAVAIPKDRSPAAQSKMRQLVDEAKAAGIVQKAIESAGLKGVQVAPN